MTEPLSERGPLVTRVSSMRDESQDLETELALAFKRWASRRGSNFKRVEQVQERCVVEESKFGDGAKLGWTRSPLLYETSVVWHASVGAVFDENRRKYIIDYATLGETTTSSGRPRKSDAWVKKSETKTLWWIVEVDGLPFTKAIPEAEGLKCEEAVIEWGRAVLEAEGQNQWIKTMAVLAVARKAVQESAPLLSTITFSENNMNLSFVSSIKFVDHTHSSGRPQIPLSSDNVELMRLWAGYGKTGRKRDSREYAEIAEKASAWGIKTVLGSNGEQNTSEDSDVVEYNIGRAAALIAVAAGWNERLAPDN
ncbi:hypothetical protein FOZ60_012077 [Perkinsus olseni]|uniref:Uncharacterized protein n=1 Tax=Perkinsus olseni TaxID=32597 RepID=A0A7J6NDD0_PEROL|nr:hypothetical protein FOZ60_012077 [Perkinsus olseni]